MTAPDIPTEGASDRYEGLETWPTRKIVDAMLAEQVAAVTASLAVAPVLAKAIDAAAERLMRGGRLLYLGAGTSGRLAALDAAELPPTFGWPASRAVALMAGGRDAFVHAVEGAEDDEAAALAALAGAGLAADDVVIGLAASGNTPYVVAGLGQARAEGALTIAIGNNPAGRTGAVAEYDLVAASGAEVVAGSTRMKAGTAQKAILTCLSTGIFIRMGFVYRGRMVEMRPTNRKLQARAVAMVAELADADTAAAETALAEAEGSIKIAVLMLVKAVDRATADGLLERAGGRLHAALAL